MRGGGLGLPWRLPIVVEPHDVGVLKVLEHVSLLLETKPVVLRHVLGLKKQKRPLVHNKFIQTIDCVSYTNAIPILSLKIRRIQKNRASTVELRNGNAHLRFQVSSCIAWQCVVSFQ